ncbi:MAG TPA: adenylate/guanylate cyclase domain-containing protein [Spirochaetia bacterium]
MSIRFKIILVLLPILFATLALTGVSSYFSASNGITRIAKDFLGFKAEELQAQAESQWRLLVDNDLTSQPEMVAATKAAVEGYARSLVRSSTELICAFAPDGSVLMSTGDVAVRPSERDRIVSLAAAKSTDMVTLPIDGRDRVAKGFWLDPFGWYVLVTEERTTFYSQANEIAARTLEILAGSIVAAVLLVFLFSVYLTGPLRRVVVAMRDVMSTNDLSRRVVVEYADEIGQLAQTFNIMVDGLEDAYRTIKAYALAAAVSRTRERKIKDLFRQYVPEEVIRAVEASESKVSGDQDIVSVLFSHITNYEEISGAMRPDELVETLEPYFRAMVDTIEARGGMVDKYITDAVMAFFGAPVKKEDDALRSVLAGIEMTEALTDVNRSRTRAGRTPFHVSVGVNRGLVTFGTIGTEKKMNYTVIGDPVNLASRLSALTKRYRQSIIFAESLHISVKDELPCRLLDSVAVKGKTKGVRIYTARKRLSPAEREAWGQHNLGMAEYFDRNFKKAVRYFRDTLKLLPDDPAARMLLERSELYLKNPPPATWDGVEVMTRK